MTTERLREILSDTPENSGRVQIFAARQSGPQPQLIEHRSPSQDFDSSLAVALNGRQVSSLAKRIGLNGPQQT